jgi:hypothetical protein
VSAEKPLCGSPAGEGDGATQVGEPQAVRPLQADILGQQEPQEARPGHSLPAQALHLPDLWLSGSVADPGSGAFLTPGSGIRNRFFRIPDLKPQIFLRA